MGSLSVTGWGEMMFSPPVSTMALVVEEDTGLKALGHRLRSFLRVIEVLSVIKGILISKIFFNIFTILVPKTGSVGPLATCPELQTCQDHLLLIQWIEICLWIVKFFFSWSQLL